MSELVGSRRVSVRRWRLDRADLALATLLATVGLAMGGCGGSSDALVPAFEAGDELLGGQVSVRDTTPNAFSHPAPGLERDQELLFFVGNSFFKKNWVQAPASTTARDGLGPLFNSRSCAGCHLKDGRGRPPESDEVGTGLLVRLSLPPNAEGEVEPEPSYGGHLQDQAIRGWLPEGRLRISYREVAGEFADGEGYFLRAPQIDFEELSRGPMDPTVLTSPRIASQVIGMGLLEALPEATLLERVDEADVDGDGISGRPNRVWDESTQRIVVGRFGWKANQPSVRQQVAAAFFDDMGIASELFFHTECLPEEAPACVNEEVDIDRDDLDKVVLYVSTLAVPAQRDADAPQVQRGREVFYAAGCEHCHREQMTTGEHPVAALANQEIRPYSDLLLHDMGPELADGRPDFEATGTEWRTPPLWGLGLIETVNGHTTLLHDGRARNVMEAVLWHGGEAETSRDEVIELPETDRDALVRFLESL